MSYNASVLGNVFTFDGNTDNKNQCFILIIPIKAEYNETIIHAKLIVCRVI